MDAFGITGVEGSFRTCAEICLGVLRNHRECLMSVLESFIHDPLCEWTSKRKGKDVGNEFAKKSLSVIEKKLQGMVTVGLPLGIEGQVHELIQQATNQHLLAQMYIGKLNLTHSKRLGPIHVKNTMKKIQK